jgi:PhnB protein
MQVQPYLFFDGRCEEALNFYKRALGAEVQTMMRWRESPEPPPTEKCAAPSGEKIMHAAMKIGDTVVMASDGLPQEKSIFEGFSLSLTARNEAECDRLFNALAEGGQVQMPPTKTFFSPRFGMVADRFGVSWMVIVAQEQSATASARAAA